MAPGPTDQKRKRDRAPGASKPAKSASKPTAPEEVDPQDADEGTRPKKRRRGDQPNEVTTSAGPVEQEQPAKPKKRGRPAKSAHGDADMDSETRPLSIKEREAPTRGKGGAGKSSTADNGRTKGATRTTAGKTEKDAPLPRRGGRPSKPQIPGAPQPGTSSGIAPNTSGKQARAQKDATTKKSVTSQAPTAEAQGQKAASTARKQGDDKAKTKSGAPKPARLGSRAGQAQPRAELAKQAQTARRVEGNEEDGSTKRRGRPKSKKTALASDQENVPPTQASPSRPPAKSRAQPTIVKKATRKVPEARESGSEEAEEAKQKSARQELRSRHLQETLRTIPRSVVESKWAPLDPPSVSVIGSILADAQRSVLLNLQDTNRRRQHASAAILQVSQRIHGKLLKGFPFPAPTVSASTRGRDASHEADFDFERTLDAKANLENTLSPLLHSVSLLRKQLLKEEYELAGEYNHLHQLETNVKHEAKEWRDKARKEHILAPGRHSKGEINDENELPVELLPAAEDSLAGSLFQDLQNQELAALSQQIKSHMESLRGNLEQIGGVGADINKSKAALQQVLLKHLNEEQYETVLLG